MVACVTLRWVGALATEKTRQPQVEAGRRLGLAGGYDRYMGPIGWLILVVVLVLLAALVFVIFRRRRRGGGVIATRGKP